MENQIINNSADFNSTKYQPSPWFGVFLLYVFKNIFFVNLECEEP